MWGELLQKQTPSKFELCTKNLLSVYLSISKSVKCESSSEFDYNDNQDKCTET